MSKFDTSPTRLIRSPNQETEKVSPPNRLTEKLSGKKTTSSDKETEKIDAQNSGAAGYAPTINIQEENVEFRSESGVIAGGNLNEAVSAQPGSGMNTGGGKTGNKTVLVRRSSVSADTTDKPIVGWLVVVSGKGKGQSIPFSYGMNKIGRNERQDIALAFGDDEISRENHAAIEFDPKPRKFYLSKGESLVYLNDERVGAGAEEALKMGDMISIGATTLRFVPFCGKDFDWVEKA